MKVYLINPPKFDPSKYKKEIMCGAAPALSLAYILAYCKKNSMADIIVEDMYFKDHDYLRSRIIEEKPDLVGFTCLTEGRSSVFKSAEIVKEISPDITVVFGGHHSTYMYEQVLLNSVADIVVLGEGEITFCELLNTLMAGKPAEEVDGIAWKKDGKVFVSHKRPFIEDLDSLPFPDYSFFNLDDYPKSILELKNVNFKGRPIQNLRYATVITSRGCPYNCQFCSTTHFWGRRWRFRSPENVCDEIEMLVNKFGIQYINFADDAFSIKPERVIALCKEILRRKIEIVWDCTTRANCFTEEMYSWMKKAGCILVIMGVESADSRILTTIGKDLTVKKVIEAFDAAHHCGLNCSALLMVGNPGESDETVRKTRKLVKRIRPELISVSITMVFPATRLFEHAKSVGFMDESFWLSEFPPPYFTAEHSYDQLVQWKYSILFPFLEFSKKCLVIARKLSYYVAKNTGYKITRSGIHKNL